MCGGCGFRSWRIPIEEEKTEVDTSKENGDGSEKDQTKKQTTGKKKKAK